MANLFDDRHPPPPTTEILYGFLGYGLRLNSSTIRHSTVVSYVKKMYSWTVELNITVEQYSETLQLYSTVEQYSWTV